VFSKRLSRRDALNRAIVLQRQDGYTDLCERFLKDPVEMGSGAISSFIKIGSDIQKLKRGDARTGWGSHNLIYECK
jgi:hypothetical protein